MVARSAILAFLILGFGQGVWTGLLGVNLWTSPAIPWSVAVMSLVLWLMWQYLDGKWWPHSTSDVLHRCLRARLTYRQVFGWAMLAGVLSIVALAGCWILVFQLLKMPGNVLPDTSRYPSLTVVLILVMASLVSPLSEEAAFRGYCQVILERKFRGPAAVVISSVFFALEHVTHGLLWPKLLVYFLAGVMFGVTAYLTKSILPGIAVHIIADLTFFTQVWPYDTARRLVREGGADLWFWIHAAQVIIFSVLSILAFSRLARVTGPLRAAAESNSG